MKCLFLCLSLFLYSFSALANNHVAMTSEKQEEVHQELRALRDVMQHAMNEQDIDTILANVDDNVIFSTMNGDVARGKNELRAYYEKMMTGDNKVVKSLVTNFIPADLSIIHGNDTAIAHGHSDDHYELAIGKKINVKPIWSTTLVKHDGLWKIANFHYSVNMFDNPILEAQSKFIWILGGGGIVLSLITFLIGRRMRRSG